MAYQYIYQASEQPDAPTLFLLHGTGGSETDLLKIAELIDSQANILAVRGNEPENGMNRFFKRHAEGLFDIDNLKMHTEEMYKFLDAAAEKEGFNRNKIVAIGYSNGANIAASLLFSYNNPLMGAILLHPMVPFRDAKMPNLAQTPVFIGAGSNDPLCSVNESKELEQLLAMGNCQVTLHWEAAGHSLTQAELTASAKWYQEHMK